VCEVRRSKPTTSRALAFLLHQKLTYTPAAHPYCSALVHTAFYLQLDGKMSTSFQTK